MTDPNEQQHSSFEPVLVMLADIKGDIKLILAQYSNLTGRVAMVESRTDNHGPRIQTLEQDFKSELEKKAALALASKESAEDRLRQAAARWAPAQRVVLIGGFITSVVVAYIAFRTGQDPAIMQGVNP
jgi:hypothetical protein